MGEDDHFRRDKNFHGQTDSFRVMDANDSSEESSNASVEHEASSEPTNPDQNAVDKIGQNRELMDKMQECSGLYSCQLCCASFPSLILFVEHRKFDCTTGNHIWSRFVLSTKSESSPKSENEPFFHQCPWCDVKPSDLCRHKKVMQIDSQTGKRSAQKSIGLQNAFEMDSSNDAAERHENPPRSANTDLENPVGNPCDSKIHPLNSVPQASYHHISPMIQNDDQTEASVDNPSFQKYPGVSKGTVSNALHADPIGNGYSNLANPEILKRERMDDLDQLHLKKRKAFYPCSYCPIEFTEISTLKLHIETIHKRNLLAPESISINSATLLYCTPCTKGFENIFLFNEHMQREHFYNETTPKSSDLTLATLPTVNLASFKEFGTIFLESSLQPLLLDDNYKQKSAMAKYLSHSIEYGCSSCLRSFPKADELQRHLMDIHACHLYRCTLCKLIFDSKVDIQVHFAVKHSNECTVFKCNQCLNSSFKTEVEWQLHVRIYHLGFTNPFKCLFCKDMFASESELVSHISTHEKQFVCPACDESFMVEYLLDRHLEARHCSNHGMAASKLMSRPNSIISHVSSMCEEAKSSHSFDKKSLSPKMKNGVKCQRCNVKFYNEVDLKIHQQQNHSVENGCSISRDKLNSVSPCNAEKVLQCCFYCKQTFKSRMEMSKHMRVHHVTPSTQKCNICDEVFSSSLVLAEHKLTHCKVVQSNLCTVCKTTLGGEEEFYSHCHNHYSQGSTMQCIICRQTLFSGLEMELHGRHHFENISSTFLRTTKCDLCYTNIEPNNEIVGLAQDALFRNGILNICLACYKKENFEPPPFSSSHGSFKSKKYKESSGKSYQCIKCQKSFSSEYDIQLHVAGHVVNDGTRHECFLCLSNFDSPAKLQLHLIEHSFPDKHHISCSSCTQTFSKASEIQVHMTTHGPSSRKFSCSECPLSFFFSAELENHRFTCHNRDPLKCTINEGSLAELVKASKETRVFRNSSFADNEQKLPPHKLDVENSVEGQSNESSENSEFFQGESDHCLGKCPEFDHLSTNSKSTIDNFDHPTSC